MNEVQQHLQQALDLLDGGTRWIKYRFSEYKVFPRGEHLARCSVGAVCAVIGQNPHHDPWAVSPEVRALNKATRALSYRNSITEYNDFPTTTFPDIERVFAKAIEIAGRNTEVLG